MPTPTNDPPEVTLLLSVSGGDDLGPFFASLNLNKVEVEQLLNRAYVFRAAKKIDTELYQTVYFNYGPEFFEPGNSSSGDISFEDAKKLEEFFEDERYPTDGIREAEPGEVPGSGTVRLEYCKLMVAGSMSNNRPDMVDFHWEAGIKHANTKITTAEVTEEVIRALLARLA